MTNPMIEGRRADSLRRRQRVVKALSAAGKSGTEITVSSIARDAGVNRSFLYRHSDLLAQIHTAQSFPSPTSANAAPVTRESLKADLANTHQRIARLSAHNTQLERKLSVLLGDAVWRESGIGAPTDIDQLHRRITMLEQQVVDLTGHLEEREQELDAARSANRELFTNINRTGQQSP